jgi:hypothetical protein
MRLVFWAIAAATDYGTGLIRILVQAHPNRVTLLAGKIAALSIFTLLATTVTTLVVVVFARPLPPGRHAEHPRGRRKQPARLGRHIRASRALRRRRRHCVARGVPHPRHRLLAEPARSRAFGSVSARRSRARRRSHRRQQSMEPSGRKRSQLVANAMVRRGSTVRVRQRASAFSLLRHRFRFQT